MQTCLPCDYKQNHSAKGSLLMATSQFRNIGKCQRMTSWLFQLQRAAKRVCLLHGLLQRVCSTINHLQYLSQELARTKWEVKVRCEITRIQWICLHTNRLWAVPSNRGRDPLQGLEEFVLRQICCICLEQHGLGGDLVALVYSGDLRDAHCPQKRCIWRRAWWGPVNAGRQTKLKELNQKNIK